VEKEQDLLSALEWRVAVHTPMDVVRCLLELLPVRLPVRASEDLLAACRKRVRLALVDVDCPSRTPSAVGVDCLRSALSECGSLSELCQFNAVARGAIGTRSPDDRAIASKLAESFRSKALVSAHGVDGRLSSSLTCVIQVARQA